MLSETAWAQNGPQIGSEVFRLNREAQSIAQDNPELAIRLARQAFTLAKELDEDTLVYQTGRTLDLLYYNENRLDSAIYYTQQYIEAAEQLGSEEGMAKGYNNLGLMFTNLGNIPTAIEYLKTALEIKERLGDEAGMASTLNNMGRAYERGSIKKPQIAKAYFKRSLELKLKLNIVSQLATSYINLSWVYNQEGKLDSSSMMLEEALRISQEQNNRKDIVSTLWSLGAMYYQFEQYDKAIDYLAQAKQMAEDEGVTSIIYDINLVFGKVYYALGNYPLALEYIQKYMKSPIGQSNIEEAAQLLASIYYEMGQKDSAYYYERQAYRAADSLLNTNLQNALVGMEMSKQAAENRRQLDEKNQELERQNDLNAFLFVTLLLVLLLVLVVYNRYNIKRRSSDELERRNKEILLQKEEIDSQRNSLVEKNNQLEDAQHIIRQQNDELTNINAQLEQKVRDRTADLKNANESLTIAIQDLDRFIYKTSHDIRGPLARLMGLCSLALLDVTEDKAVQYFSMLDITAKSLNSILVRLITINEINNSKIKKEVISFDRLQEEVEQSMQRLDGYQQVALQWNLPDFPYETDHNLILLILSNLVENGVKFRNTSPRTESFVKIDVTPTDDNLIIKVCDNGIGIDNEEREKLHLMFTKSVENYEITGLGLYLVKLSVDKLKGKILMGEGPEATTCMQVILPITLQDVRQLV